MWMMTKPACRRLGRKAGTAAALCLAFVGASGAVASAPVEGVWEGEITDGKSWPTFIRIDVQPGTLSSTMSVLGQKIDLGKATASGLNAKIGDGADQQVLTSVVSKSEMRGRLEGAGQNASFVLSRVPKLPVSVDRVQGWNADLTDVETRVLRFDRSYSAREKAHVRQSVAALRPQISRLSDDQMRVEIATLLAMANNAHTRLYLLRNRTELGRLPIRVWWFEDQLRIVRAAPGNAALLGCRIAQIGGLSAGAAYARVEGMYSGSPGWKRYMSQYTLTSPSTLRGSGIGKGPDVNLDLEDCPSSGRRTLTELPFERSEKAVESWWDLAPELPSLLANWSQVLSSGPLPAYLRHASEAYWFDGSRADGIFYLQLNRAGNSGKETVKEFADRAAAEIQSKNPRAIVVDVRFNTGGDSTITRVLVDRLASVARNRPIYAIVWRSTFSAGIVAAAQLKQFARARIVGEPVGDNLEFWAEGGNIILRYSGLAAHFANGAHSISPAHCPTKDYCDDLSVDTLEPDVPAPLSWVDYRAGVDPADRAILRDLTSRSSPS